MSEIPTHSPEKHEALPDNDRKFIVEDIDTAFLKAQSAISYDLITDWLETNKDNEKKLARKRFADKDDQLLHIAKVKIGDERQTVKDKINSDDYESLLAPDLPHVEKKRYEFNLFQNGTEFKAKYDVFANSPLRILEIDAENAALRESFDPDDFSYKLKEVSDDENYSGFRIAAVLQQLQSDSPAI